MSLNKLSSRFTCNFLALNNIDRGKFNAWYFRPGMLFQDKNTWWNNCRPRKFPHEGIDFQAYHDHLGRIIPLDKHKRVPAILDGVVGQIFDDFLGKTIHTIHRVCRGDGFILNSLIGHVRPAGSLKIGSEVREGDDLGRIAKDKRDIVLPHFHLTLFWAVPTDLQGQICWETINDKKIAELLDPLGF